MQYLLLIYDNEKRLAASNPPPEGDPKAQMSGEYRAFGQEFAAAIKGGNALQATANATTVRVREGKRLTTDGPFAETKEQLGGYYLIDAPDLDRAIEIAARVPAARTGSIELRPILNLS